MALNIIITDAGRAELINANHTGTAPVAITHVAFSAQPFTPTKGLSALPHESRRLSSIAGETVAPDTISVTVKDESSLAYTVHGFGLITEHGTLLAVYSQAAPIIEKSGPTTLLLTTDIVLADIDAAQLSFGDISFSNPPASLTTPGVVTLSNSTESSAQNQAATPRAVRSANDNANTRLAKSQNLTDLASAAAARVNLGLGTAATLGTTALRTSSSTTVLLQAAAMNDHRQSGDHDNRYPRRSNNLSDLSNASTARDNLGLGAAATRALATRQQALDGTDNTAVATMLRVFEAFGQYGLGRASLGNTSMAGQLESGFYRTFTDDPDSPTGNAGTWVEIARDSSSGWRLFMNASTDRLFFQRTLASGKREWREILHDGNQLVLGNSTASARAALQLGTAALQEDARYPHRRNNLSDLSNASKARDNLGLGAAATRALATRQQALDGTDNTAVATMLRVFEAFGQYGLGRASLGNTSMAGQLESGFYRTFTDDPDSPTGNAGTWIEIARDGTSGWRLFMNTSSDRLFFQRITSSGKQEWREVYHRGNLSPVETTGDQTIAGRKTLTTIIDLTDNSNARANMPGRGAQSGRNLYLEYSTAGNVGFYERDPAGNEGGWRFRVDVNGKVADEHLPNDLLRSRDVGESSGNVMPVGAFGLGATTLGNNDFSPKPSGFYRTFTGDSDSPVNQAGNWIEASRDANSGFRLFGNTSSDRFFLQRIASGLPRNWLEIVHSGNFAGSLAGSGWQPLPGGMIFQWGVSGHVNGDANVNLSFPIRFPNGCWGVFPTIRNGVTGHDEVFARPITFNATSCTIRAEVAAPTSAVSGSGRFIHYFAIGN